MLKKTKKKLQDTYLNGFLDGSLEAIDTLKVQKEKYGELANINDLIALIEETIEEDLNNLLSNRN